MEGKGTWEILRVPYDEPNKGEPLIYGSEHTTWLVGNGRE
jgi:hypothetical protein